MKLLIELAKELYDTGRLEVYHELLNLLELKSEVKNGTIK